jgi:octaprenyl-diphosphate synthase
MKDLKPKILAMVKDDLADIETALLQNLNPYLELVSEVAGHILFSGGKRLRPLLMVLSTKICGNDKIIDKTFSIIFEYLHAATLLHDDIVDEACIRRGQPVAHSIWGNPVAVLVGDFLLARSLSVAAKTGRPEVIKVIAEITESMSQGEIHQLMRKKSLDLSEEEYLEIVRRKTAVLIQGACIVGAIISDASAHQERALSNYGFNLGVAFQMVDDLLDYASDTSILGKEIGADLKEGKLTLPVIHTLRAAKSKDRDLMEQIIINRDCSAPDIKTFLVLLKKYGGLTYTKKMAAEYVKNAKDALTVFEPSEAKDILLYLADCALTRKA